MTYQPYGDSMQHMTFAAFDLLTSNMWNSGCYPSGFCPSPGTGATGTSPWISADFKHSTRLTEIRLIPGQDIVGVTRHMLLGTLDGTTYFTLARFMRVTRDSEPLIWRGSRDVVGVKVVTSRGPSWGWRGATSSSSRNDRGYWLRASQLTKLEPLNCLVMTVLRPNCCGCGGGI